MSCSKRGYERCVVSPGPCTPEQAGITLELVRRLPQAGVPTLGVCLGHQALAQAFGGRWKLHAPVHGKATSIEHDGRTIFRGLSSPLTVGRYHSLVVDDQLPDCLEATAHGDGVLMGVRHRELPAEGVQFHPESVLTEQGRELLANFLSARLVGRQQSTVSRSTRPTESDAEKHMPNAILTAATDALASAKDLSADQTAEVLAEIMHGEVSEIQIAGFLIALRTKGETVEELEGLARTMRALAAHVPTDREDLLDTAGTGGGRSSFNVSTTAALIAAGAGCAVAKHGNRSATSRSGSADLLEALDARIDLAPDGVAACIDEAGFGFMFAPAHHQATRFVVPVRRELAVRTIFNLLGPLTNPAGARRQLIGVSDAAFMERMAGALARLGVDRALIVAGEDGLDEVSADAPTKVAEVNGEEIRHYVLTPEEVGVEHGASSQPAPAGGTPAENAQVTRAILRASTDAHTGAGEHAAGERLAVINAGAAIYAAGAADSIAEGVQAARAALADGAAANALERFVRASQRHAPVSAAG